jgi:nitrogen regulatory protein PII
MNETNRDIRRITAVVNRDFLQGAGTVKLLKDAGISSVNYSTGRAVMLRERRGSLPALLNRASPLVSSPVDTVSFFVEARDETAVIGSIIDRFKLDLPGSGSVYSEDIHCEGKPQATIVTGPTPGNRKPAMHHLQSQLTGICCIVIRGMGDQVARVALETGSCVPTITYGQGAGLRDRLGLWRILIPAEKEIVTMVVNSFEAEDIMNIIIDVAKIDQPGRGFIYMYPVRQGLINLKVSQSSRSQAASIEQVVLAIDELKGSAQWRRRRLSKESGAGQSKRHMVGLSELLLHCDEDSGADFVRTAMEKGGAPGATITSYTAYDQGGSGPKNVSPARESCSMIVETLQVIDILEAFEEAGVLDKESISGIETKEVFRAYSYAAK